MEQTEITQVFDRFCALDGYIRDIDVRRIIPSMVLRRALLTFVLQLVVISTTHNVLAFHIERFHGKDVHIFGRRTSRLWTQTIDSWINTALDLVYSSYQSGGVAIPITLSSSEKKQSLRNGDSKNYEGTGPKTLRAFPDHATRRKTVPLSIDQKLSRDITALKAFYSIYGHYRVPYYYIIPDEARGDSCTNSRIRRKKTQTLMREKDVAGLSKSLPSIARGIIKEQIDVSVPSTHSIHSMKNSTNKLLYPVEVHGLKLGRRLAQIRKAEIYVEDEQRLQLAAIGLEFPFLTCLKTFVPVSEIISGSDLRFNDGNMQHSSSLSGIITDSGRTNSDNNLSNQQAPQTSREHLSEMRFLDIFSALETHNDIYGDMLVPRYFVVPSEEPWPKRTWGMQLGNRVRNIRVKTAYNKPKFHEKLISSGFAMSIENMSMRHSSAENNMSVNSDILKMLEAFAS